MNNCFFISEGAFTFKVEGTGTSTYLRYIGGFFMLLKTLKINPNILRKLLLTCTTEVPFYDHLGNICVQTDGVSMGSVLGPMLPLAYIASLFIYELRSR